MNSTLISCLVCAVEDKACREDAQSQHKGQQAAVEAMSESALRSATLTMCVCKQPIPFMHLYDYQILHCCLTGLSSTLPQKRERRVHVCFH